MSEKYFGVPFAASGDKAVIPVAAQPSGAVSFTEGFGLDYERNPATDPQAKRIPRDETNQLYYDVTNELGILQRWGVPDWIPASLNGGSPVSYGVGAAVRYGGVRYQSIAAANTAEPGTDATKWLVVEPFNMANIQATYGEVIASSSTSKFVTAGDIGRALRNNVLISGAATRSGTAYTLALPGNFNLMARAIAWFTAPDASPAGPLTINVDASGVMPLVTSAGGTPAAGDLVSGRTYGIVYDGASWVLVNTVASQFVSAGAASESVAGVTRFATASEANALASLTVAVTPGRLPLATTTQQGLVEMATNAEAAAGASATLALSPASAAPLFGALTPTTRTITAGAGLSGGGDLTTNRSLALGTPSTITGATANSASGLTHTHALSIGVADVSGLQTALDGKAGLALSNRFTAIQRISGAAGTNRELRFETGTSARWIWRVDLSGEGGSNTGSNAQLLRVGDDGTSDGVVVSISRQTGVFTFDQRPTWGGGATPYDSANLPIATASQYRAATAGNLVLTPSQVWAAAAVVTLTQASTVAVDMSAGINFTTTMTGNRTLGAPSNAKPGQSGFIEILQDGTGTRTLAYASAWVFAGGVDPVLTTTAGARDVLAYTVLSSGVVLGNLLKGVA